MNMLDKISGQVQTYTLVLCNRNHDNIGLIQTAENLSVKINMNASDEITFSVNQAIEPLWDKIEDFKYVLVPEINYINHNGEYFEIAVSYSVEDGGKKTITGISAGECELGQVNLYGLEINSGTDIDRTDYKIATIWSDKAEDQPNTLLARVLKSAPNWSVGHVDQSIAQLQRTFSVDSVSVYDFLAQTVATEVNCFFQFDSYDRVINVYDLYTVCSHKNADGTTCGERGDFYQVCPKCGTDDELVYYGKDTTVYIDAENLTDNIQLSIDKDSVKNCFHLSAGDDDMTAAVRNCTPANSNFIYYFSDDQKKDMSKELKDKLDEYEKKIKETQPEYSALMEKYYDAIDKDGYYTNTMMPTIEEDRPSSINEYEKSKFYADKLTETNLSPISLDYISRDTSQDTVENALEEYAKVYVPQAYYNVKIAYKSDWENNKDVSLPTYFKDPEFTNNDTTCQWKGILVVVNYNDEAHPAFSQLLTINVNAENQALFIKQKIEKALTTYDYYCKEDYLANQDDRYMFKVLQLTDIDKFKEAIQLYCLTLLYDFENSIQGCLEMLYEFGDDEVSDLTEVTKLYDTYNNMKLAVEEEIEKRVAQVNAQEKIIEDCELQNNKYKTQFDLKTFLGNELYSEFCAFRREETYSNENYISDSLDNAKDLFKRANEFYKEATKELKKASNYKYSITTDLLNLLAMKEFEPLASGFNLGDWIRVGVDNEIFRLRFIGYTINFDAIDHIEVEFSDATKARIDDPYYTIKTVLDQSRSMATSYSYITHQVKNNSDKSSIVDNWIENGFDATKTKFVSNAESQNLLIDQHGLLARRYSDINKSYDNRQLKILNNGMYITDDNWKSIKTALGNFIYTDNNGEKYETYGILADSIVGKFILGNKLSIEAISKDPITGKQNFVAFNVDGNGATLNNGSISLTASKLNDLGYRNKIVLDPTYGFLIGDERILDYTDGKYKVKEKYINEDGTLKYDVTTGEVPEGISTLIDINKGNVIINGSLHAYNGFFSGVVMQGKTSVTDEKVGYFFSKDGSFNLGTSTQYIKMDSSGIIEIAASAIKFHTTNGDVEMGTYIDSNLDNIMKGYTTTEVDSSTGKTKINGSMISSGTIAATELASKSVTTEKIAAGAVITVGGEKADGTKNYKMEMDGKSVNFYNKDGINMMRFTQDAQTWGETSDQTTNASTVYFFSSGGINEVTKYEEMPCYPAIGSYYSDDADMCSTFHFATRIYGPKVKIEGGCQVNKDLVANQNVKVKGNLYVGDSQVNVTSLASQQSKIITTLNAIKNLKASHTGTSDIDKAVTEICDIISTNLS